MDLAKIVSVESLKNTAVATVSGGVGSMANRYVSKLSPLLSGMIAQLVMVFLGIGGFLFLKNKKSTAMQFLKFFAVGLGFQSVSELVSYAGVKLDEKQQESIAAGEQVTQIGTELNKALTPTAITGTGLGNAGANSFDILRNIDAAPPMQELPDTGAQYSNIAV